jgi:hypothetical protein
VLVLLLLAACDLEVHADAFDQSCAIDDDCVLVEEGDVCGRCTEPASVSADAEQDFLDAVTARTRGCTIITLPDCPSHDGWTATCDAGTCRALPPE